MHYFIDGYNLLFRLSHDDKKLQNQREAIILDLNKKISVVKIEVSIVFDSAFQIGGRSRSHYDALEILFTAQGETADEYILEEIKNHPHPDQETVVTSDKKLAMRARHCFARTESVEEFMQWLNRSYKNKIRQKKKEKRPLKQMEAPIRLRPASFPSIPEDAPLEAFADYYHEVFEAEWKEIVKKEDMRKANLQHPTAERRPARRAKRQIDPFETAKTVEEKAATEMERWLKLFERRFSADEELDKN
jgi:uncharacterized protein